MDLIKAYTVLQQKKDRWSKLINVKITKKEINKQINKTNELQDNKMEYIT